MGFFDEEKLYKVEIIKKCPMFQATDSWICVLFSTLFGPRIDSVKKGNFGCIPAGIKGWVVKKWGRKYFTIDENQEELFDGLDLPHLCHVLFPYKKIKGCYKMM